MAALGSYPVRKGAKGAEQSQIAVRHGSQPTGWAPQFAIQWPIPTAGLNLASLLTNGQV